MSHAHVTEYPITQTAKVGLQEGSPLIKSEKILTYQIQFLKFSGYTHAGKARTDKVSVPGNLQMFIDMLLHGFGCRTAPYAVSLTMLLSRARWRPSPLGHAAQTPSILEEYGRYTSRFSYMDLPATLGLFWRPAWIQRQLVGAVCRGTGERTGERRMISRTIPT